MQPKYSQHSKRRRVVLLILASLLVAGGLFVYFSYDPAKTPFPQCPVKFLTGLDCPGCGSQRAMHCLLHGDIAGAWRMNPLLIICIPYLILGFAAELMGNRFRWLGWVRKYLYGATAAWIFLAVTIIYTILRNII